HPRRCTGHRTNGEPCEKWAMQGSTVCSLHLPNPAARKKAAVRRELMKWGLGDTNTDPGELLLRLVSQSASRVEFLSGLLEEQYNRADAGEETTSLPARVSTLIGRTFALNREGKPVPVAEAIRGLQQLESEERDRAAGFAAKAIAAGLAERQVRLAERQGAMIAEVLRAVLGDTRLGLDDAQVQMVPALLREHLAITA
ncbi:MAG: hypothetical protein ACRDRO_03020, partial [Pseudonocardiaceae bacterium]